MIENLIKLLSPKIPAIYIIFSIMIFWILQRLFESRLMRNIEKIKTDLSKESFIYTTKKDAIIELLSVFADTFNFIEKNYNYQDGHYYPLEEAQIQELQKFINKNSLYIDKDTWISISLIMELFKLNSDFVSKVTGDHDLIFDYNDYYLACQIYDWVILSFRKDMKLSDNLDKKILYVFIIIVYMKKFYQHQKISDNLLKKYDYSSSSILDIKNYIYNNKQIVKKDLDICIKEIEIRHYIYELNIQNTLKYVKDCL